MKTFNGVVALTVEGLETTAEIEAVKRSAQILHYTLAAFIGPSGKEVIILVRVEKLSDAYSTISDTYSSAGATYLTEEEADTLCQEGHRSDAVAIAPRYFGISMGLISLWPNCRSTKSPGCSELYTFSHLPSFK